MNYEQLNEQLTGRCKDRRKLANNTYAERRGEGKIAIRLHATDIMTFHANGFIGINSGGWRTVTTKARINDYLPNGYRISQERSIWYWRNSAAGFEGARSIFTDGDTISPDGSLSAQAGTGAEEKDRAMLKRIDKYAKLYGKALPLDRPSGGDCWGCHLRDSATGGEAMGTDHLLSHMDEGYVVPSLAQAAMKAAGAGVAWYWCVFKNADGKEGGFLMDSAKKEIVRWVRRYMRRRLGLAS
jgi:hypothetical protein